MASTSRPQGQAKELTHHLSRYQDPKSPSRVPPLPAGPQQTIRREAGKGEETEPLLPPLLHAKQTSQNLLHPHRLLCMHHSPITQLCATTTATWAHGITLPTVVQQAVSMGRVGACVHPSARALQVSARRQSVLKDRSFWDRGYRRLGAGW